MILPAVAFASLAGALMFANPVRVVEAVVLAALMAVIAEEDRKSFTVPGWANGLAALVGLIVAVEISLSGGQSIASALITSLIYAIACGTALFLIREVFFRLHKVDGLGFGDVKLGATAGIWLGWEFFCYAVLIASLACLAAVAIYHVRTGDWVRGRKIPFALALAPSIWLCWMLSQTVNF